MEGNSAPDDARSRNRPPILARRSADRHYFNRIGQKSHPKDVNPVILPQVDVARDVAAINRGEAIRKGDRYTVYGRLYGLESSGTLFPISGDGCVQLSRGAYAALGVYRTFGFTDWAEQILARMHNVGSEEHSAARAVVRSASSKGSI